MQAALNEAAHVVDQIVHPNLDPGAIDASDANEEPILAFCRAKTCSTMARTLERCPLRRDVASLISLPLRLLVVDVGAKPVSSSHASFLFER